MKKNYFVMLLFFAFTITSNSQIPTGYYDSATGTGYTLKSQLHSIISTGHIDKGYSALYTGYLTTDSDNYYENDGTLLDMYSENPSGLDPYNYTHNNRNCGTYNSENDCYNREHLFPQGIFSSATPMRTDIHHVVPSDGYVNGRRSNYPFGEVSSPTWTSMNGSKLGPNTTAGYSGTVFEPIDEFKGDIARCMLYFATRYETQVDAWTHDMLNGTEDQVYADWFITLLVDWHINDPVSQREIDRNNAAYAFQGNRNPFIDHPEYVAQIWSAFVSTPDSEAPTAPANLTASSITNTTLNLTWDASTDNVGVASYEIFQDGVSIGTSTSTTFFVSGLTRNTTYDFTVYAKDAAGNTSPVSNTENVTTTDIDDVTPPTAVNDVTSSNVTDTTVDLSWSASTDNVAVTEYEIFQDGVSIGTTTSTSFNVTGLSAETTYDFTVFAKDAAGNTSASGNTETVTTTAALTGATDLFISEYVEGSGNSKSIEIANFTGLPVDLSIYSIKKQVNGAGSWGSVLTLSGTLGNGTVYVISNSGGAAGVTSVADLTVGGAPIDFNGNDPIGLFKNDVLIDIVGVFDGGSSSFAANVTLRRKESVSSPNITYTVSEWDSFAQDTFDGLGIHNMTLSTKTYIRNAFNVYPNPVFNGKLYLNTSNGFTIETIEIYNFLGTKVFEQKEIIENSINIDALSSGIYILKVSNEDNYSTRKIIVN